MLDYIKSKCSKDWLRSQVDPALSVSIFERFNPDALLVGFGRRFATYKSCLLYTSWNDDVKKLYCDLDPGLWKEVEQNPVLFLERINYEKLVAVSYTHLDVYKRQIWDVSD